MQRLAAILLLLCYAGLGTGAAEYLHNAEHAAEDATLRASMQSGVPLGHLPLHDESNCPIHAQLHICCMALGWMPLLVCLGLFVAFLTLLASCLPVQRVVLAISCRGPPIR